MDTYFEFLDELRESGETNMFGAAPYLVGAFALSEHEARRTLVEWIMTFDERRKDDIEE